jgi:hypothetical protein
MRMRMIIAILAAAFLTGTAAGAATAAASASAPPGCANGIYAGYDGTQQDASGQSVAVDSGRLVAAAGHYHVSLCFFWFAYEGGQDKIAEWAPDGVASNEVMAAVWSRHGWTVGLQKATGSLYQQWNYNTADNGTWTNEGTGTVLAATARGNLYLATAPEGTVPGGEDWTFTVPARPAS